MRIVVYVILWTFTMIGVLSSFAGAYLIGKPKEEKFWKVTDFIRQIVWTSAIIFILYAMYQLEI